MLSRRRILTGLLAAPAIIKPSLADAAFAIFQASTSGVGGTPVLPPLAYTQGIPRRMNPNHPLSRGCIWFAWDTGLGFYVKLRDTGVHGLFPTLLYNTTGQPGGGFFTPGPLPARGATSFGNGLAWPGGAQEDATFGSGGVTLTSYIYDGADPIRVAQGLSTQSAGVGFTMGGCHIQTGPSYSGLVVGRIIPEQTDYFVLRNNGANSSDQTNRKMVAGWYDGANPQSIVGTSTPPLGSVNCSFVTAFNTGSGIATVQLIVNGNVENSATGTAVVDLGNGSGIEQTEGQMNIGQFTHLTANHCSLVWSGGIPWAGVWNRRVYAGEAMLAYARPRDLVVF